MATIQTNPSTVSENSTLTNGIGAYHLAANPELYEPQRLNNFVFQMVGLDGILRSNHTTNDETFENADEVLQVCCKKAFLPTFSQKPIEVRRGNTAIKFAGVIEFSSGQLELYDFIGAEAKDILMAWQFMSGNPKTEKVGLAEDYKRTCYVSEYTPDYQLVRRWVIEGCWISDLKLSEPDNSSSGQLTTVNATIQYDKGYIDSDDNGTVTTINGNG